MSINKTTDMSASEIDAWITAAVDYKERSIEEIKNNPAFLEWAADVITPDKQTDEGWIPGWTLDNCARKWFEHNYADGIPSFPAPNGWAQSVSDGGFKEVFVNLVKEERNITALNVSVTLERVFCLSYGSDRDESIQAALRQPAQITLLGSSADIEITDPADARAVAVALLDLADGLEAAQ